MRGILLVGQARQASTRVADKMTRSFCDTSLYEIYLRKLEQISQLPHPFSNIVMAINRNDEILWEMSQNAKIEIAQRDNLSVASDTVKATEIQSFLKGYKEKYVMNINGCCPFLKPETIIKIADYFNKDKNIKSLSCVRARYNHFWDSRTHKPLNNTDPTCLRTQALTPVYENVNFLVIYNKDYFFEHNCYWDYTKDNPHLYVVSDSIECLDIDTELEFELCEMVWRKEGQYA